MNNAGNGTGAGRLYHTPPNMLDEASLQLLFECHIVFILFLCRLLSSNPRPVPPETTKFMKN